VVERRLKPGWRWLGAAAFGAALWYALPLLLGRLEFFRVRRVEISGLQYLAAATVIATMQLPPDASVFDDPTQPARRLRALPGIVRADIERRLPGTLQVRLQEAEPVALTPRGDRLALVDSSARELPFDPLASAPDLPVLVGGGVLVTRALSRVRDSDPGFFARVDAAWRVGPDVVLEVEGRRFWFGAQLTAEDIRAVTAVEQALARQGRNFQELDGRYAGQVVVRWSRA
jgi:cell division septal protein FtsQ